MESNRQANSSLNQIMHGAAIAMIGIFTGLVLQFGARILIARYFGEDIYGVFSLAIAVLNLLIVFATLGFQDAIPRYISHFNTMCENDNIQKTIKVSLLLSAIVSITLCFILFALSGLLSNSIYHLPGLEQPLKVISIAIPFITGINIITAIFRGSKDITPHAIFQLFCINAIFIALLLFIPVLNLPFIYILYAYTVSIIVSFIILSIVFIKRTPQFISILHTEFEFSFVNKLIKFSLPLMGTTLLAVLMTFSDTIFLGYFRSAGEVGIYNSASSIGQFIYHPLSAWLLIYVPVATALYEKNDIAELKQNYKVVTKWIITSTIPMFLVVFFFPEAVINLIFGSQFMEGALALRILAAGFIINNLFGLRAVTLIALGDTKFIFWANLAAAIICVLLNTILIPTYGIDGAAVATSASLIISSLLMAFRVYQVCGAQPFSRNLIKPVIASVLLAVAFKFFVGTMASIEWWILLLLFIAYCAVFAIAILITRSFDSEDIQILLDIEKAAGINAEPVKRILRRFL